MDLEKKIWVFLRIIAIILAFCFWKYIFVLVALILILLFLCLVLFIGALLLCVPLFAFCAVIFAGAMTVIGGKAAFTWSMWFSYLEWEKWENGSLSSLGQPYLKTATGQVKKRTAYPLWRKTGNEKHKFRRTHIGK